MYVKVLYYCYLNYGKKNPASLDAGYKKGPLALSRKRCGENREMPVVSAIINPLSLFFFSSIQS